MHRILKGAASAAAAAALALSVTVASDPSASAAPVPAGPAVAAGGFSLADEKAYIRAQAAADDAAAAKEAELRKALSEAMASHSSSSRGLKALAFARRQIGDRYRYGATGPSSWDCSGLTRGAWKSAGVKLPHSSRLQYYRGKRVLRKNLRKGDLVFFYSRPSHVGIYAGNGRVIHASRPGKPVGYAKISWMPYKGARRVG